MARPADPMPANGPGLERPDPVEQSHSREDQMPDRTVSLMLQDEATPLQTQFSSLAVPGSILERTPPGLHGLATSMAPLEIGLLHTNCYSPGIHTGLCGRQFTGRGRGGSGSHLPWRRKEAGSQERTSTSCGPAGRVTRGWVHAGAHSPGPETQREKYFSFISVNADKNKGKNPSSPSLCQAVSLQ